MSPDDYSRSRAGSKPTLEVKTSPDRLSKCLSEISHAETFYSALEDPRSATPCTARSYILDGYKEDPRQKADRVDSGFEDTTTAKRTSPTSRQQSHSRSRGRHQSRPHSNRSKSSKVLRNKTHTHTQSPSPPQSSRSSISASIRQHGSRPASASRQNSYAASSRPTIPQRRTSYMHNRPRQHLLDLHQNSLDLFQSMDSAFAPVGSQPPTPSSRAVLIRASTSPSSIPSGNTALETHHPPTSHHSSQPTSPNLPPSSPKLNDSEPTPTPPAPRPTTTYWLKPSTRRKEYAKIDRSSTGFRGLWRRLRRSDAPALLSREEDEKSDFGSVRRYRLDLSDDDDEEEEEGEEVNAVNGLSNHDDEKEGGVRSNSGTGYAKSRLKTKAEFEGSGLWRGRWQAAASSLGCFGRLKTPTATTTENPLLGEGEEKEVGDREEKR